MGSWPTPDIRDAGSKARGMGRPTAEKITAPQAAQTWDRTDPACGGGRPLIAALGIEEGGNN